jgi:hypothetical protein
MIEKKIIQLIVIMIMKLHNYLSLRKDSQGVYLSLFLDIGRPLLKPQKTLYIRYK